MKSKIMIIANDTTYVYNTRIETISRLIEMGYEVTVVSEVQMHKDTLIEMGCLLVDLRTPRRGTNPLSDVKLFFTYLKLLKKHKPDVVLSFNIKPNVYGGFACQLLGIRYLANVTGLGTALEIPGKMQKLTAFLYKMGVSGAECVFFQNSENEQFFRERKMISKKSRVCLLPGSGVNVVSHPLLPYPEEDKLHFLFVARVLKEKGIDQYLAVSEYFRSKRDDVVFHICGGCDDARYEEILSDAQKREIIEYHGEQEDMIPFFRLAACIVHPSYYPEGMSNVLLEAAASGRPVIATNRSGCRETVDDGVSGYIVPIKETEPVIEALEKFLALSWEERKNMGLAGRAKVEREFDRQIVVDSYEKQVIASLKKKSVKKT